MRETICWDYEDSEILRYHELDDAVEAYLDGLNCPDDNPKVLREQLGAMPTLKITGYAHVEPKPETFAEHILEDFLARLHERYGNHDDCQDDPTDAMKQAALQFAFLVIQDFRVWICEPVCTEEVNALEWAEANRPHWLDPKKNGLEEQ